MFLLKNTQRNQHSFVISANQENLKRIVDLNVGITFGNLKMSEVIKDKKVIDESIRNYLSKMGKLSWEKRKEKHGNNINKVMSKVRLSKKKK